MRAAAVRVRAVFPPHDDHRFAAKSRDQLGVCGELQRGGASRAMVDSVMVIC